MSDQSSMFVSLRKGLFVARIISRTLLPHVKLSLETQMFYTIFGFEHEFYAVALEVAYFCRDSLSMLFLWSDTCN